MSNDALFADLFDDAAVFPPKVASFTEALDAHRTLVRATDPDPVSAFLCPSSQVEDLRRATTPEDFLRIGIVGDDGLSDLTAARAAVMHDPWIELVQLEVALPPGLPIVEATRIALGELSFTVPTYLEMPRTQFDAGLDVLAEDGAERAKFRTGGLDASAIPSSEELAAFIVGCSQRRLAFKLTGGLNHAVRGADPMTGWDMHGVLNVLIATDRASTTESVAEVAEVLELREVAELVPLLAGVSPRVRDVIRSLGCSDVSGPIADLVALGLVSQT